MDKGRFVSRIVGVDGEFIDDETSFLDNTECSLEDLGSIVSEPDINKSFFGRLFLIVILFFTNKVNIPNSASRKSEEVMMNGKKKNDVLPRDWEKLAEKLRVEVIELGLSEVPKKHKPTDEKVESPVFIPSARMDEMLNDLHQSVDGLGREDNYFE